MNVLDDIIDWLDGRPDWQAEALRRLVEVGDLGTADITDLAEICKKSVGLATEAPSATRLKKGRTAVAPVGAAVRLMRIEHSAHVNALAAGQGIAFELEGLTVIYGSNGSGKSGYARILKHACRARGAAEEILTNVFSEGAPGRPSALVEYVVGDKPSSFEWGPDAAESDSLGLVSVFDTKSAQFYVSSKADVAFRPFGLDLFDKLARAFMGVAKVLNQEKRLLESAGTAMPELPTSTAAGAMLRDLTALTPEVDVRELATLSHEEDDRRIELRSTLDRARSETPGAHSKELRLQAGALIALADHCESVGAALGSAALAELTGLAGAAEAVRKTADRARASAEIEPVKGTGSKPWEAMWAAAREFSTSDAYPDRPFPHVDEAALCVLCQQEIGEAAAERLQRFRELVTSTVESDAVQAEAGRDRALERIRTLAVDEATHERTLESLDTVNLPLADAVREFLAAAKTMQTAILRAPAKTHSLKTTAPDEQLRAEAKLANERAAHLAAAADPKARAAMSSELAELDARAALGAGLKSVLREIERKKRLNAYNTAIKQTSTNALTRKSTDLTRQLVTETLQKAFRDQVQSLSFPHEVELSQAGGGRGSLYHQVRFKRAPQVTLPTVVSEGEARCLAVAAFLAELATANHKSAILFDDPVSSLDHEWRDRVARRLAEEAADRQVIVLSHDIVFLTALREHAANLEVPCGTRYLRRERGHAGLCSESLPWPAMKVKDRIGRLRSEYQQADKTFRTGDRSDYERHAREIYGLLREAWERAVEEVLLGGVVERFSKAIQTQKARYLADITDDDYRALDAGMTKASAWIRGHDQPGAVNAPVPDPTELASDIQALDAWVKAIRKRRN